MNLPETDNPTPDHHPSADTPTRPQTPDRRFHPLMHPLALCCLGLILPHASRAGDPLPAPSVSIACPAIPPNTATPCPELYDAGTRRVRSIPALVPRERWERIEAALRSMEDTSKDASRAIQPLTVNGREPSPLTGALDGSVFSQLPAGHKLLLYQCIEATHEGNQCIRVLTQKAARVWLNGSVIWSQDKADLPAPPSPVVLPLKKGTNHLVVEADPAEAFAFLTTKSAQRIGTFLAPILAKNPAAFAWFEPWLESPGPATGDDPLDSCLTAVGTQVFGEIQRRGGMTGAALASAEQQLATRGNLGEKARLVMHGAALRRTLRLKELGAAAPSLAYCSHRDYRPSFFAYVEGLSDARAERHFLPGSSLMRMDINGGEPVVKEWIRDDGGMIRDPDVSYDGKSLLFSWKKSDLNDDFHLYEMDMANGRTRQITHGLGSANYEGAYLPDDSIVFSSTRNEHSVPCWVTEVSNLYKINRNGSFLRRLAIDQVHSIYPKPTDDGRITYTRWDYNDRGQVFPQPLFQMNQDGTMQGELYGGSSWFPTTLLHARQIPGTQQFLAIASGHHTPQAGKVVVIDTDKGRDEGEGIEMIAPRVKTAYERVDAAMQSGSQFSHPFPLGNDSFVCSHMPAGRAIRRFDLYWFDGNGGRELLAPATHLESLYYPVAIKPRERGHIRPDTVDYQNNGSVVFIEDVYKGPGLEGVPRGTADRLRVVEIRYRSATVGAVANQGEGGGSSNGSPVAIAQGSWDVKAIIGETPIHPDGSVMVKVPAMKSIYYQILDKRGDVIQTMRTWDTNRPGEVKSCVGCHSYNLNAAPTPPTGLSTASRTPPATLVPFPATGWNGFSFPRHIQPILDRHCVACHKDNPTNNIDLRGDSHEKDTAAKRNWSRSYIALTNSEKRANGSFSGNPEGKYVRWINKMSKPTPLEPYSSGAAKSPLLTLLRNGHHGVKLSDDESRTLSAWIDLLVPYCGDYHEGADWDGQQKDFYSYYEDKRRIFKSEELDELQRHKEGLRNEQWFVRDTPALQVLLDREGSAIFSRQVKSEELADGANLTLPGPLRAGDTLRICGASHLRIGLGELPDGEIFTPSGDFRWKIEPSAVSALPPSLFTGNKIDLRIKPLRNAERGDYRNLACNPLSPGLSSHPSFPVATASSETRNDGIFAARNAIDGCEANQHHGKFPFQSWGPEQENHPWITIDFGRKVRIDRVDLILRADFPHDESWHKADLVADGTAVASTRLTHTGDSQTIRFKPVECSKIELRNLEWKSRGWCALSEMRVWGLDADRTPKAIIRQQAENGNLKTVDLQ